MLVINNDNIKEYEKLVYSIIKSYSNTSNKEDLFQEGMMGLLDASKNYDENSGTKFSTYAYMHILGRVLKYVREDRNIKIGRDLIKDYRNILLVKDRYYKTKGKIPTNEEISHILKISINRVNDAINYNESELRLNKAISNKDKEITLEDTIYNKDELDHVDRISLKDAINSLEIDERDLIYKRYYENRTQTEIANENNTSQVKVYRLERKTLDKLKEKIG